MDDLATLTAQPQTLRVAGREYKVHPLTIADFGKLQEWVDRQFPSPWDEAKKAIAAGDLSYPQQKYLLELAMDRATKARHKIGQPEADDLIQSLEGYKQVLVLSIRKGDPSFSEADAEALFAAMTMVDVLQLQNATNLDMVLSAPKADPPLDFSATVPDLPAGKTKSRPKPTSVGGKSSTRR